MSDWQNILLGCSIDFHFFAHCILSQCLMISFEHVWVGKIFTILTQTQAKELKTLMHADAWLKNKLLSQESF